MKKKLPKPHSDEKAEEFVADADPTEYDLSEFRTVLFEFQPRSERVNMRLPKLLLDAVKASASKAGGALSAFHSPSARSGSQTTFSVTGLRPAMGSGES